MINSPQIYYQKPNEAGSSITSQTQAEIFAILLEEWKKYIVNLDTIENRNFILHQWFVCQTREWSNHVKPIERIEWVWNVSMKNTIRRELVIRIKRRWDDIVAWQQSIRNLEKVLLICAGDRDKRNFLFWIKRKYEGLFTRLMSAQEDEELEKEAEKFYNECIYGLKLTP